MKLALLAGVLVVSTTVVVGCAKMKSMVGMGDPIVERQQLMKEQGAAMKSIQDKLKADRHQAIGPDAEKLVDTSKANPFALPAGLPEPQYLAGQARDLAELARVPGQREDSRGKGEGAGRDVPDGYRRGDERRGR